MKKVCFFLFTTIIMGLGVVNSAAAQNLLIGGNMESVDSWTLASINTSDVISEWNYTADKPLSGNGGVLHVSMVNVSGNSQFGFYQAVNLEAGKTYMVDAAVKIINQVKTSWFEVYIGTVDPTTVSDYSVPNNTAIGVAVDGIAKIASYYSWWSNLTTPPKNNSTIQAGANQKAAFTPTATGTYYFFVKLGSNSAGRQEVLLDNVIFGTNITPLPTKPTVSFEVDRRVGFAPLTVNLKSTSTGAESFEWKFGNGVTSSTANTTQTFSQVGKYDVKLKATNTIGFDTLEQKNFIHVMEPVEIVAGGVVAGGNMENISAWQTSTLNSPLDLGEPTCPSTLATTWNYQSATTPTAGNGGALRIQIDANGGDVVQYCIYQKVNLKTNTIYKFDAAYRDHSPNLWHCWSEVYISKNAPVDGSDYGTTDGTRIAELSNWDTKNSLVHGLDGTYQLNSTVTGYSPATAGEYYLILKVGVQGNGTTATTNPNNICDVLIDEISLTEINPKPYVNFSAEGESGFSPLTVQFKNLTQYGKTYEWNFGDGSPKSTEFEPKHIYTAIGDYTVTLKSSNEKGDSTLVKTAFVSVVEPYPLPNGEKLYGGNMEKGGFWKTTPYGQNLKAPVMWNYKEEPYTGSEGGVLRVQTGRIALYQKIEVKAGHIYKFDCDVHVKNTSSNMWIQTFMWESEPPQDADVLTAANSMAELRTYADASVSGYVGKFSEKCIKGSSYPHTKGTFKATANATMWFAIKLGTNSTMDVLLDNLSLKEELAPAEPDFSSDVTYGDPPLTVQFFDMSEGAVSWAWDFGDGHTLSGATENEQHPIHTYMNSGKYTVSLTVTDINHNTATKTFENYITVTGESGLNDLYSQYSISIEGGVINIDSSSILSDISIYDIRGVLMEKSKVNSLNFKSKRLSQGLYILSVNGKLAKIAVK